jgi:hypothetical protein
MAIGQPVVLRRIIQGNRVLQMCTGQGGVAKIKMADPEYNERVVQGGGNSDRGQRASQGIVSVFLPQERGFQEHLGQLFDEQGYPIGLADDMLDYLHRQGFPMRQPRNQCLDLGAFKTIERQRRHMRPGRPGRHELRTKGQQV